MRIQTRIFLMLSLLVLAVVGVQVWLHYRQMKAVERSLGTVATSIGRDMLRRQLEVVERLGMARSIQGSGVLFRIPAEGLDWETMEGDLLRQALDRCNGNRAAAARLLGLGYKAFLYRLEKFDLAGDDPDLGTAHPDMGNSEG